MPQTSFRLIDDAGEVWHPDAQQLRERYAASCEHGALGDFLIKNVGFVAISGEAESWSLKCAPSKLRLAAVLTVGELLPKHARRVSISWFDTRWRYEIIASREGALKRIVRLAEQHGGSASHTFAARARDPAELEKLDHPLSALWARWRDSGAGFDHSRADEVLNGHLEGKYCVIERKPDTSSLVFAGIGDGIVVYRNSWKLRADGLRIEDQPDVQYGKNVAQHWRSAFIDGVPTLFDVDAVVHQPPHREYWRTQYTRLTLPLVDHAGRQRMLSTTYLDRGVDLRLKVD